MPRKKNAEKFLQRLAAHELTALAPRNQGKALIKEAVAAVQEKERQHIVQQVQILIERAAQVQRVISRAEKQLALTQCQLKAIHDGAYTLTHLSLQIKYNDRDLNVNWDDTAQWV